MAGNGWRRYAVGEKRLGQLRGYPPKLPHKLGPKLNGYTKARDDSQEEASRALLFSLAESQDVIGFFLYFYTDSLKYLALELKEISICGLIRGN